MHQTTVTRRLYRTEGVIIDTGQRCVVRGDETVQPRAKTFELLVYLVEHRDRVVPKDELREALWGQVAVTENSVMQCVAEARRVLGDDSKEPRYIRTVSKSGYQFIAVVAEDAPVEPVRSGGRPWERYRDWETDRKSTRLNSSHSAKSRMPSSA